MERWKRGTEKSDFLYYQPRDVHLETPLTSLQEFREFHRLATMEASRLLAKEKPEESWMWARAIMRCSRHFGRHGGAIERVFGMSFHVISINVVLEITQDAATSEQLLTEMLDDIRKEFDQTAKNSTMLKWEYLAIKNSMQNEGMLNDWVAAELNDLEKNQYSAHRLLKIEPFISQLIWQQYIANLLEQIDLPLCKRQPRTNYFEAFSRIPGKIYGTEFLPPSEIERLFMETIILRKLNPNYSFLDQNCTREQVRQHALELCIALQIYHRRHDHYPTTLDELVHDQILDEIPLDPFSPTGERMRYRLYNGEAYVWSIDENGVDDGGLYVDSDDIAKKLLDTGLRLGDSVEARKP